MNVRPRLRVVLGLLAVGLATAGCVGTVERPAEPAAGEARDRIRVVATMSILGDLARDVGGDHVEVTTLVPIGGDPHLFEPPPSAAAAIEDADVVLANGLGLEPWFDALSARAGDRVTAVAESAAHQAPRAGDDAPGGALDPHLWMVPPIVADHYVPAIRDALVAARPQAADDLRAAADRLADRLAALDAELADELERIPPQRRRLVTSHDAYAAFGEHYGFEIVGSVFGVSTEREPSAAEVAELIDRVRDAQVPTVFVETTIDPALIERVARDAGVAVGEPLYGDSLGPPGSDAASYAGMLRTNVATLVAGLEHP